jgi:ketosteroid isomerase-like protein
MKIRNIILMLLAMTTGSFANPNSDADADRKAVKQAVDQFYLALDHMFRGDIALMKEVWSHADDTVYMGPDGKTLVGWGPIGEIWDYQASLKLGGKVVPADMTITVGTDIAVTHNLEVGENDVNGEIQKVSIRATNVFRKEDGKWKMIAHHTDLLPFLEK